MLLRARNTGTVIIGEFSTDDGATWVRVGQGTHAAPLTGALKVGPVAFRGANGGGNVTFDYLRLHGGSADTTPVTCSAGCSPQSDQFIGSELDPKWSILNPSAANPPTVGGGHLTLPIIGGDIYGDRLTAQVLTQDAPTGSWVATAKVAHANISQDGEAAGLALINSQNPNHFLKTTLQYKNDTDPDTPGDQNGKWAERVLTADGQAVTLPPATVPWPNSGALSTAGDYVWVRFVHDATAGTITTWTSTNGATFTSFGAPISVSQYLGRPGGLKVGVFAKHDGSANDTVQFDAFNLVPNTADPQTAGDNCGGVTGCVQNDEFDGTALDAKWDVRNPTPANLAVAGGKLALTTAQGDVSGANFTARNVPLQDVPSGPWSVTTKLDHTAINQNGVAGGLVVYGSKRPELLRQDRRPVQDQRPLRPADERHLGGAGADRQRDHHGHVGRPVSEHRQAHPADQRSVAAGELRRHEPDLRVLVRRDDVHHHRASGAGGDRVRYGGHHEDRPVRQARLAATPPGRSASTRSRSTRPAAAQAVTPRRRGPRTRSLRPRRTGRVASTSPT